MGGRLSARPVAAYTHAAAHRPPPARLPVHSRARGAPLTHGKHWNGPALKKALLELTRTLTVGWLASEYTMLPVGHASKVSCAHPGEEGA